MADLDNRRRGRAWRESVAMRLQLEGFADAQPRPSSPAKISDALAVDKIQPDVLGLPSGWFLRTASDLSPRWGSTLDGAQASANFAGFERCAVVQYRRDRPIADSFVVMTLSQFAGILRRDVADWKSLQEFETWMLDQANREE